MNVRHCYELTAESAINLVLLKKEKVHKLSQMVKDALAVQHFTGKIGDVAFVGKKGQLSTVYIAEEASDADAIAHAMPKLPEGVYRPSKALSQQALVMWSLAQYQFDRYKKKGYAYRRLCVSPSELSQLLPESLSRSLVRDLINAPANDMHPEALTHALKDVADRCGATFHQWVGVDLLEQGFPAVHAVGRGASVEPRIGFLTHGQDVSHPHIVIVGKGVCFDSGGLDIKTASSMRLMKKDMGGAGIAIGLAQWLLMAKLPIRLTVIIPAVENAISAKSYRPGDILTMRSGLSVEIDNTDAEGRLILADALAYACEQKPDLIIDFATLTGAARVAVGTQISAFFTNQDALALQLMKASEKVDDPIWRMPLFKRYAKMNDSLVADLSNSTSSSYAGAITAALFLERFIQDNIPWIHFDTMAWNERSRPGHPEGGEAMAMMAVAAYLLTQYQQK
jgi:leucyl aminopeptidase